MPRFLWLVFVLTGVIPLLTIMVMRFPYLWMSLRLWNTSRSQGITYKRALLGMRDEISKVRRNSVIQSFNMSERRDRIVPFFMITVFYVVVCVMMSGRLGWGSFFIVAMLTIAATSLVVSLITLYWKISVHSVALCSLIGFLLAAMVVRLEDPLLIPLLLTIICAGFVISARLYLNAHTPKEVGYGALIGFLISFTVTYIYF